MPLCKPFAGGTKQQKRDPQRWQFGNPLPGSGIILTAVYLIFAEPILTAFGGKVNAETFALSKEYFFGLPLAYRFICLGRR